MFRSMTDPDELFAEAFEIAQEPGREAEAEAAYRLAAEAGYLGAWVNVGALRAQAGDDQGAEACYRTGAEGGESLGWVNLAYLLCDKPGREAEAAVAYRAAIEAGHDEWN